MISCLTNYLGTGGL